MPAFTKYIVPLGIKECLVKWLADKAKKKKISLSIQEMNWWQSHSFAGGKITALPAQHWSRRICQGTNKSLWACYMLETPTKTIYFAGDSGYFIGYREIGKRFPQIDYAFLPITAFHPRWFMHYPHMDVKEALLAF